MWTGAPEFVAERVLFNDLSANISRLYREILADKLYINTLVS
jgi:hypothetical protein